MMKHCKKLFAAMLALAMLLVMTLPAAAAGETFTITNTDAHHNYEIYQIFYGEYAEGALSNAKWGANAAAAYTKDSAVSTEVMAALEAVSGTNAEKLAAIEPYADLESTPLATITGAAGADVPAGYYLIKDADGSQEQVEDGVYTVYLAKAVGEDITIEPKSAKPTLDKQVYDNADGSGNTADGAHTEAGWYETADHAINESFQFKLIATLPDENDMLDYAHYRLIFTDTLSKGITYESMAGVTVNGVALDAGQYTVSGIADGTDGPAANWTVTIPDLMDLGDKSPATLKNAVVEVTYNAHLNAQAVVGDTTANNNKAGLSYSNNPRWNGTDTPDTGKTPEDTVWVFTYNVDNIKKDGANGNAPMGGAEFTLYQADGQTVVGLVYDAAQKAYRPVAAGETAAPMVSSTDEDNKGRFNIIGLDVGTYVLKETKTPAGYNTCDPITVEIKASHAENADGTSASAAITKINGSNEVINLKGATLPTTGGIGTTVFYVVGGLLMAGAAVLLIAKKRMSGSNK